MINNNKILTVSYGTFSCTLEGFDDSFGTMKAIAEYFRDLAADDRYFGAEPPQPDAQMLASIAQREVSRRVEAREHDGKIVLSALEDGRKPETAAATATAHPVVAPAAPVAAEDMPRPEDAPSESATNTAFSEVAQAQTEPDVPAAEAPALAPSVQADADTTADERDIVPGQPDAEVEAFFDQIDTQDTADAEVEPDAPASVLPTQPAVLPDPPRDSIAAKLQRIRAVVAQHDEDAHDTDYTEDEHAAVALAPAPIQVETPDSKAVIADARADIEAALSDEGETEEDADADIKAVDDADFNIDAFASDDDVDDIANMLRHLGDDDDTAAHPDENANHIEVPTSPVTTSDADDASDDVTGAESDLDLDNLFETEGEAESDEDHTPADNLAADDLDAAQAEEQTPEDAPANVIASEELSVTAGPAPDAKGMPRARVIKVKRADLEAAIETGTLEEYDDEDTDLDTRDATTDAAKDDGITLDDLAPARVAATSLSPEDESELARELAALEADMTDDSAQDTVTDNGEELAQDDAAEDDLDSDALVAAMDDKQDDTADSNTDDDTDAESMPRAKLPQIDDNPDTDRIAAEADSQMDEPEGATRRDAFAQLRAAVAAKKADDAMGTAPAEPKDGAYRDDLANVVRPRRASATGTRTERPSQRPAAPLKLVAEQRIDAGAPSKATGPISPRRVARAAIASDTDDSSFTDFANEMGATELPDLLEAAAAYMSFVENRDVFTRPQLMSKVRQAGADGFNREDTLRFFGKLLREGKIEKVKAGQFSASDDIGFNPSRRAG